MITEDIRYDIMIDIETLGIKTDCIILSIGACFFDINSGEILSTFYKIVDIDSQVKFRSISAVTIKFWINQNSDSVNKIFNSEEVLDLHLALNELTNFISQYKEEEIPVYVWSNGADFDIAILSHACYQLDLKIPWDYDCTRDVRTIVDLAYPHIIEDYYYYFEGIPHYALDDAINQAKYVSILYQQLKNKK